MKNLAFLFFVLSNAAYSQDSIVEATIPSVSDDGFYNLKFDPTWAPYLNESNGNIRIVDKDNKEVPYILQKEIRASCTQQFKQYQIVEKRYEEKCCTTILLLNPDDEPINNINLTIRNAEVTKRAHLTGSDDNKTWYALKQHFMISSINNTKGTSEIKIIDFPLSNYAYYKLQIDDSVSAPINILSAGYYEFNTMTGSYTVLDSKFRQLDSVSFKKSYVFIDFDEDRILDKLHLAFEGQPYFLRRASLFMKTVRIDKKGKPINHFEKIIDFTISSKQKTELEFEDIRTSKLQIIIENDDNPSLKVKQAEACQLNRYLTTWLQSDNVYKVSIGDKSMTLPRYDLIHFKESIASGVPLLVAQPLIVEPKDKPLASATYFTNKYIIWMAIVLVITIFGIMAIRMVKEASKNEQLGD